MPARLDTGSLPASPVDTFMQDYARHEAQEQAEGYEDHGVNSLCARCVFGFVVSCGGTEYKTNPELETMCTGPWLKTAIHKHNVTNCNGFVEGAFDVGRFGFEKALPKKEDEEAIDTELSELEKEGAEVEKSFPPDPDEMKEVAEKKKAGETDPTVPPSVKDKDEEAEEEGEEDEAEDEDKKK